MHPATADQLERTLQRADDAVGFPFVDLARDLLAEAGDGLDVIEPAVIPDLLLLESRKAIRCILPQKGTATAWRWQNVALAALERAERAEIEERWLDAIPAEFHDLPDVDRLPNRSAHDVACRWGEAHAAGRPERAGLVLFGLPGRGKTRAAVEALRAAHALPPRFESCVALGRRLREAVKPGSGGPDEIIDDLHGAGRLLLDDLDKMRLTPRLSELMFEVLDTRLSDRRLTVATMQSADPDLLSRRLCGGAPDLCDFADTVEAIVDRLRERRGLCRQIDFDASHGGGVDAT